jgi:hypothetical protein
MEETGSNNKQEVTIKPSEALQDTPTALLLTAFMAGTAQTASGSWRRDPQFSSEPVSYFPSIKKVLSKIEYTVGVVM